MKRLLFLLPLLTLAGCHHHKTDMRPRPDTMPASIAKEPAHPFLSNDTPTEAKFRAHGLVDIHELDTSILVNLVYSTPDNFMHRVLYKDIHKAFMLPQLADKLVAAQAQLRSSHPGISLIILDASRPLSIQRQMFHQVQGTPQNIYVSNPLHGPGLHNYGAAVDIALADTHGQLLPMGSDFDHFGPESHITNEKRLLADGIISQQEYDNRLLLRQLMVRQGLQPLHSEWWHFNLMSRAKAKQLLKPLDF